MSDQGKIAAAIAALTTEDAADIISVCNTLKASGLPRTFTLERYSVQALKGVLQEMAGRGANIRYLIGGVLVYCPGGIHLDLGERNADEIRVLSEIFPEESKSVLRALAEEALIIRGKL